MCTFSQHLNTLEKNYPTVYLINPIALKMAKTHSFGHFESNRVTHGSKGINSVRYVILNVM